MRSVPRLNVVLEDHQARLAITDAAQENSQRNQPPELTQTINYLFKDINAIMEHRTTTA